MSEKEIITSIKTYLNSLVGCFSYKTHGGLYTQAGIPDIVCCYKGRFVGLEVKTEKGKVTVLQQITINKIRRCGGIATVVRSVDEVKQIIEEIDKCE